MGFTSQNIREYSSWSSMHQRCGNPKCTNWHRYGGRGITVAARWDSFRVFLEDMGPRPEGTSLDRIDNDGNYEPGNCRWATSAEQAANKSMRGPKTRKGNGRSLYFDVDGQKVTTKELARMAGLSPKTIRSRLAKGWSTETAISLKSQQRRPRAELRQLIDALIDCRTVLSQIPHSPAATAAAERAAAVVAAYF